MTQYRYTLSERDIPKTWYNVIPDLPAPLPPPLHPGTGKPAGPQDLAPIFPMALIEQEVSAAPSIPIPEPVLDVLRSWRPTPLYRAERLEHVPDHRGGQLGAIDPGGSQTPLRAPERLPGEDGDRTHGARAYPRRAGGKTSVSSADRRPAGEWAAVVCIAQAPPRDVD